jgi:peroxiredoxin
MEPDMKCFARHLLFCLLALIGVSCSDGGEAVRQQSATVPKSQQAQAPATLAAKLEAQRAASATNISEEAKAIMAEADRALQKSGIHERAVNVGQRVPLFELPDHTGSVVRMYEFLEKGPVVLMFYRGGWCPYCNLQLQAMEAEAAEIKELGATLLAITPDLADDTAQSVTEHALSFPVLTDKDNKAARAFGLVFQLSPELNQLYGSFGINLKQRHESEQNELPLTATYVIARNGVVRYAFLDTAYYHRAEPADVVAAVSEVVGEAE